MLIATVGSQVSIPRLFSNLPYLWSIGLTYNSTGTYWETIFGAPHESQSSTTVVIGCSVNDIVYTGASSLADCLSTEASWYFDGATQVLNVHLLHDVDGLTARVGIGKALGFSDDAVVNINEVEYLPLIEGAPSLSQVQDLIKYDKLATINGNLILRNIGGLLDYLASENIIGGDVVLSYLSVDAVDETGNASGSDVVPLAAFYVEDYKYGFDKFTLSLQDKRKSQDVSFPTTQYLISDYPDLDPSYSTQPIPVVYGYQRELKATPVNGKASSTTTRYRAGLLLTALTTVWVKIQDTWTVKTPTNINLATGEFDIAGAKAVASDSPYECKVEATGIAVTHASDVIKDLNLRYAGIPFAESFYDTAEWTIEEASLLTIGVVFKQTTTIFDAVKTIQEGANVGFRYEINPKGQRTIRIDTDSRTAIQGADNVEILEPEKMLPVIDTQFLAAQVRVGYQHSDESGKYFTVLDSSYHAAVLASYRTSKEVRFDTLLTSLTHATTRAAYDAILLSAPFTTVQLTLRGERFLSLRILDILPVALTADAIDLDTNELSDATGRIFYGVRYCKVIGIDPDFKNVQNNVTLKILGQITPSRPQILVYHDDITAVVTAGGYMIRTGGS